MTSTITLNGNPVTVVALPSTPGLRGVEFSVADTVASVISPFTGQVQVQQWPGADLMSGTVTLPPLTQAQADQWISALMECRGMANGFLIGDPARTSPNGNVAGTPMAQSGQVNVAGSQILFTGGWTPSQFGVLLPGDYLQLGYRLHRVLDVVDTDASGTANFSIWPSIREPTTQGQPVILNNPMGLFRLATNKRGWAADYTGLTRLSFQIMEYR